MDKKIFFAAAASLVLFFSTAVIGRADDVQNVLRQPEFSSKQYEGYGSYGAAIGIASGTITEFGTTTAGISDFSAAHLGWECDMRVENNAMPYWCAHSIPLVVATTTNIDRGVMATVFQNPHQAVEGNVELYYVRYNGGQPLLGVGVAANTVPGLSWGWTCGLYCTGGGPLGGTSPAFVPYFEMGPQADPPRMDLLQQSDGRSDALLVSGGTTSGPVKFMANVFSSVSDPLVMQVEIRKIDVAFLGEPTAASSNPVVSGARAAITVSGLSSGDYHWAARVVDTVTSESSPWVSFGNSNGPDFVAQMPRDAVIIIPGILGSRLSRANEGSEVWPDINRMLFSGSDGYLDDLSLASDGSEIPQKEMKASSVIDKESVLGISQDFYGNLFEKLREDGYAPGVTLFAYPYDWRRGAEHAVMGLADLVADVRKTSPTGKVSFVAHSFGGLVLKQYLAGITDNSLLGNVVLAGVPQLGAPESFKVLQYGSNLGFQFPIVGVDILNSGEVKKISQNMPSLYELLPSEKYITLSGGYVKDLRDGATVLDHEGTTRMMLAASDGGRNAALLAAADHFHTALDGSSVRAPLVYNIVGCSEPTISEFHIYDGGVVDVKRSIGDGTVPEVSAMNLADGFKNYFVLGGTGITHAGLVSDARPVSLIATMLDGEAETVSLPDGISRSLGDCVGGAGSGKTMEISVHGSVGLTVSDAAGDHIGLNTSGTIDIGIPGGTYDAIGDNYFITVPAPGTYRATMNESTSSEGLIIHKREYDGGMVSTSTNYIVPNVSPNSTSSAAGTTTAQVDIAASGETKLTITTGDSAASAPTPPIQALASGNVSEDIMPPVITMPDIVSPVLVNSTATLMFSATDTESGVVFLKAMFDGVPVASGATVTFETVGAHIFRVQAIDAAGNPAMRELSIMVSDLPRTPPAEQQVSFMPLEDTFITNDTLGKDNGSSQFLRLSARGKGRALVKFDNAAINEAIGSSTVLSAKLVFSITKNWKNWEGSETIGLYPMSSSWNEHAVTWAAATPGGAASATEAVSNDSTSTISFEVTSDVKKFFANGGGNNGWMLKKENECIPGVVDFGSRESDAPPKLMVSYL